MRPVYAVAKKHKKWFIGERHTKYIMRKENCIFCKIINGDIPSRKLYEDDNFIVIMDVRPVSKGHALIILKEHYANIFELPEELCAEAMKLAKNMATKMTAALNAEGFNIVQNNGEAAGQTVFHFHMHLIPRYAGDSALAMGQGLSMDGVEMEAIKEAILK